MAVVNTGALILALPGQRCRFWTGCMAVIRERSKKQDLFTEKFLLGTSVGVWSTSGPLHASAHTVAVSGHPSHVTCKVYSYTVAGRASIFLLLF